MKTRTRPAACTTSWSLKTGWRAACGMALLLAVIVTGSGRSAVAAPAAGSRVARPATVPAPAAGKLVVIKRFGAALRTAPSSNARITYVLSCGSILDNLGTSSGWYHVIDDNGTGGWVGGLRVALLRSAPKFNCADAITFNMGDRARTYVAKGCLSLRVTPSRQARYSYCVPNGHLYTITNGPIEVAGEDWFGVWSASTGAGWSLAQYLQPYLGS